ncbi:MAG: pyrroline-5-carboxylate reductase [Lachnospiraceae bacterium]|nr:pyrroline-5-carboxylate reductase [Lachnospiraceae bacterium]
MSGKIGFIGCGNMGSAIARAVARTVDPSQILLANRSASKAEALAAELGARTGSNLDVASACEIIFLGVKPAMMEEMLLPLREELAQRTGKKKAPAGKEQNGKDVLAEEAAGNDVFAAESAGNDALATESARDILLVTMAAGLTIADIQRMAGGAYPVIRIMPNTPVSIGKGMTLACASPEVSPEQLQQFDQIMSKTGRLDYLDEHLIDAASALSGCGPAYVYLFIEALSDGAVECGLPRAKAMDYACQTLIGAASLVQESGSHPGALKDAVCSPGGTTIAGVHALEKAGFRSAAMDAVKAAYDKTVGK